MMEEDKWQLSGRTFLFASVAGLVLSGPLLGLMSLSLFGTLALFVVAFPLLLLFSPIIIGSALVIAASVVAFSTAGAMAVASMAAFGWAFKQIRPGGQVGLATRVVDKFVGMND